MKCEECLPLIEEYVDGELDEKEATRLNAHLTTCADCAQELETLGREQEIYARYERGVEVAPSQWNIVRARIEQEREEQPRSSHENRRDWFKWLYSPLQSFRPGLVAALVILAVGLTAGVMYLSHRPQTPNVARDEKPKTANPEIKAQAPTGEQRVGKADAPLKEPGTPERAAAPSINRNRERDLRNNRTPALVRVPRSIYRKRAPQLPIGAPDVEEMAARKGEPLSGDFDSDVSRHAERAQMLLRSFRNMRTEESAHATDVSYEKEQSRRLLYQNIALRRNAEGRGDEPARELLDSLEPILLDIANLPDKAGARDVRSIEQRMKKKEIVAALQVRQLLAAN